MKYTFTALALAAVSLATPVPEAAVVAPPAFKITKVTSGGSGCPQGSIDVDFTDSKLLPIYFSKEFTARVGNGILPEESRKNCQLNLAISYSPGFSYSVFSADYSGWADLDSGVKGTVKATYYFSGEQDQVSLAQSITGPYHGKYTKHDDIENARWSPCGSEAMLNINSDVSLTPLGTSASGALAATRESARFSHVLYIKWKQC